MNIYDFDDTIYDGDSSIDFFRFCIKKRKKVLLYIPKTITFMVLYKIKLVKKEKFKSAFFSFVKAFDNIENEAKEFWKINEKKIKEFYLKQKKNTDIIVSASPFFLLNPIAEQLNVKLFATNVNIKTGKLEGNNCYGKEKVNILKRNNINNCNNFYSDSLSDEPLAMIAKSAYIVKGNEIIKWKDYKSNFKVKSKFLRFR